MTHNKNGPPGRPPTIRHATRGKPLARQPGKSRAPTYAMALGMISRYRLKWERYTLERMNESAGKDRFNVDRSGDAVKFEVADLSAYEVPDSIKSQINIPVDEGNFNVDRSSDAVKFEVIGLNM